jgi:hypothetical protein
VDAEALGLETELDLLDLELLAALLPGLGAVVFALLVTDIFIVVLVVVKQGAMAETGTRDIQSSNRKQSYFGGCCCLSCGHHRVYCDLANVERGESQPLFGEFRD